MALRHLLRLTDFTAAEIDDLLKRSIRLKKRWKQGIADSPLSGMCAGLIFEKPSTRTRVSFEVAMRQLGGSSVYLDPATTQIKRGEPIADSARVLSRYLQGIVIRTFAHETAEEWAKWATVPVVNGLTDLLHPCQVFCDLMTIVEKRGAYRGLKIAYIGDGNNMANSWMEAAALLDFSVAIACPEGYDPDGEIRAKAEQSSRGDVKVTRDPMEAASGADVIYTDVWASMGQEKESAQRRKRFKAYQVNS
ncbi:MAG TPA: ornithine carbamoyltransferase, partial [Thermodesulfobacteriota bacterium]|nr:ornithine carbamoyltransferase [Thermodesulfobacteriota bacterium]